MKYKKYFSILILVAIALAVLAIGYNGTISATANNTTLNTVEGEPSFNVFLPQNTVTPGEQTTINLQIRNTGVVTSEGLERYENRVVKAKSVEVSPVSVDDLTVRTGTTATRDIRDGGITSIPVVVSVPEDVQSFNDIDVEIQYSHLSEIEYNTTTEEIKDTTDSVSTVTETVTVQVVDQAQFTVSSGESDIPIGETGISSFSASNTGNEDVTEATLNLQSTSQSYMFGNSQTTTIDIGDIDDSETENFDVTLRFSETASKTSYSVGGVMEYMNEDGQKRTTEINGLSVRPIGSVDISTVGVDENTPIGGSGITNITLENEGPKDLQNANLKLTSNSNALLFESGSPTTSFSVGEWDSGDSKEFNLRTVFSDDSTKSDYSISGTVNYDNEDDISNSVETDSLSIKPLDRQKVEASVKSSDLREGEESQLTISIENNGPRDVTDTEVSISNNGGLNILQSRSSIGDLESGDSTSKSFKISVPKNINSYTQNIDVGIDYEYGLLDTTVQDEELLSLEIERNRQVFELTGTENKLESGGSGTVKVEVKNTLSDSVSDLDGEFSASEPLSISQDTAFIDSLDSGESEIINIPVSVDSGSPVNTYSLSIDFQYKDNNGDSKLSDVYSVPINVENPENQNGTPVFPITTAILIIIIVSVAVYYRNSIRSKIK